MIREYQDSDREDVLALLHDFHTAPAFDGGFSDEYVERFLLNCLGLQNRRGSDSTIFLVEENSRLIAFACLESSKDEDSAYIPAIYSDPAHRGRGLATQLIESCELWAQNKGRDQISLHVDVSNDIATRLYKKMGFSNYFNSLSGAVEQKGQERVQSKAVAARLAREDDWLLFRQLKSSRFIAPSTQAEMYMHSIEEKEFSYYVANDYQHKGVLFVVFENEKDMESVAILRRGEAYDGTVGYSIELLNDVLNDGLVEKPKQVYVSALHDLLAEQDEVIGSIFTSCDNRQADNFCGKILHVSNHKMRKPLQL